MPRTPRKSPLKAAAKRAGTKGVARSTAKVAKTTARSATKAAKQATPVKLKKAGVRKRSTAISAAQRRAVQDIASRYGAVIDLEKHPAVLVEIVRNFGHVMDDDGGGGMGGGDDDGMGGGEGMGPGGPGPGDDGMGGGGGMGGGVDDGMGGGGGMGGGVSSILVAGPDSPKTVEMAEVMRVVLELRKEIRDLSREIAGRGGPQH